MSKKEELIEYVLGNNFIEKPELQEKFKHLVDEALTEGKWQVVDQLSSLERGDIIRSRASKNSYVVESVYGRHATAVNTVNISNPEEWEVLKNRKKS